LGGNHRIQEVARKLGEMWNALTDEEKLPFQVFGIFYEKLKKNIET
jgi:hypothetical protein